MIGSATLRELISAGLSAEQILAVSEAIDIDMAAQPVARSAGAVRQERYRNNKKTTQDVTGDVTSDVTKRDVTPPPKDNISNPPVPFSNENGASENSDQVFWDGAKTFLKPERSNPGSLIGKWCRDYGKPETAEAITRAQLDRPAQRIPFIEGILRQKAKQQAPPVWDGMA